MPDLMIFAAGKGTRMKPLTDTLPKPLIKVGGQTLLDRAIALGQAGGAGRIVVNTHYLGGQIAAHLAGREVTISAEQSLLETGGGLRNALALLTPGAVMTLNPDVVFTGDNPLATLQKNWREGMGALLLLVPADRAVGRVGGGDFTLHEDGRITRGGDMIFAGAHMCLPERLSEIEENVFSLNRLWDLLMAEGRAFGMVHPGHWADVGRPDCIPLAEALLNA
ncbi:MAG: nucleotidyltransferase family protein [Paracoccus sp. (in: a-proteobacteria)]|nr:nucleotidyltransferase family protein [Paracoccus sp. (in: a-proteobacteria)]